MATQVYIPRAADADNEPVSGAEAYFFQTGTSTPVTMYSDTNLTNAHPVPLVAGSGGVFDQAWHDGSVNIRLQVTQPGNGAEVFPIIDPAFTSATSGTAAAAINFAPTASVPQSDVQAAIAYNGDQRHNRNANVKTFLASASTDEMKTALGIDYSRVVTDWDDATKAGEYSATNTATNSPTAAFYRGYVSATASLITQLLVNGTSTEIYARHYASSTWSSWVRLASKPFTSPAQTITSAGGLTIAHGLSGTPSRVSVVLKCTTAEHGYSIGDEVIAHSTNVAASNQGVSIVPDATNLNIRFGSSGTVFPLTHKTTGAGVNATNASWTATFTASL